MCIYYTQIRGLMHVKKPNRCRQSLLTNYGIENVKQKIKCAWKNEKQTKNTCNFSIQNNYITRAYAKEKCLRKTAGQDLKTSAMIYQLTAINSLKRRLNIIAMKIAQ